MPSEFEVEFEKQLENFRSEVIHAVHCAGVILTFRDEIFPDPEALHAIQAQGTSNFWSTTLEATETSLILTLTRVFENGSANSINHIMRGIGQHREELFSSAALTQRKLSLATPEQREKISKYPIIPGNVPAPTLAREIADALKEHREHYENQLMVVRNKWAAHREFDEDDIWGYLKEALHTEPLSKMVGFLFEFEQQLFGLYWNGNVTNVERLKEPPKLRSDMGSQIKRMIFGAPPAQPS